VSVVEVDFTIELGTRSEAIVSAVRLSSWRGGADHLPLATNKRLQSALELAS
jgi:hypothetical protein